MILSIILSALDLFTTIFITQNGGVELNPIPLPILIPIKIIVTLGLLVFVILAKKWKVKILLPFVVFDVVYSIAVIHNMVAICMHYL